MNTVCLVSPLHDPEARLLAELKKYGQPLHKMYRGNIAISLTEVTSTKIVHELLSLDYHVITQPEEYQSEIGANYRQSIKKGLEIDAKAYHLLDFDRALHWVKRFPEELEKVIEVLPTYEGLTSFVRSHRAYETHPLVQRSTEATINAIASEITGKDVDIASGSLGMDAATARLFAEKSKNKDYGIYAELLKIAVDHKLTINTYEVEGLEWETPDQFEATIKKVGYMEWLHSFESLDQWEKRIKLIDEFRDELL